MLLQVLHQIKDFNRKEENLAKIKHLEEQVDFLKQVDVTTQRFAGIDTWH
jgi:hypothetical protein